MYFHKAQEKPQRWGNFADVQYSIKRNMESIYKCNPDNEILIIPGFWGLPCLDYSKYSNYSINHGAKYQNGGLSFGNGTNDYVECADIDGSTGLSKLTASCWINLDTTGYFDGIFDKSDSFDTNVNSVFRLFLDNSVNHKWRFKVWDAGGVSAGNVDSDIKASIGSWSYVVGIYNGSEVAMWVNGIKQVITQIESGNLLSATNNFRVGVANNQFADCNIAEIRISKSAQTADQIALFYDRPWDLYRRIARPVYFLYTGFVLKPIEAKYDIQLQNNLEAKYDLHAQKIVESLYDIMLQKLIEAKHDILLQKIVEAPYDIILQKLIELKYDILLQKLVEIKYDVLLQQSTEAKYDIHAQKIIESIYDILAYVQKLIESKYDILLQNIIESKYDIYAQKDIEAIYNILFLASIREAFTVIGRTKDFTVIGRTKDFTVM